MIDEQLKQRIKDANEIVDVIGQFVSLHKRGINYIGTCPFHPDKHPSMTVSPSRQTVKRNIVQEMLRIKFRHPENFMPTRTFYHEVGINQMRWWDLFHGRKNITQTEYIALSKYFGLTLEEAFEARQLCIFEEGNND